MERRLSAILAADVVGYSRLMEQDEAGTFERLRAHRKELFEPEIERHHGRVFKLMGDGLLAEFSSVVDAVECAVVLQRSMAERNDGVAEERRIDVRMGVNLGDVIVEGDDRHGEGVVIAARLEQLAEPGGIAVARTVVEHVAHKLSLRFDSIGDHSMKNIAEPVAVYRVAINAVPRQRVVKPRRILNQPWRRTIGATAAVAIAVAAVLWAGYARQQATGLPLPEKPSIAVLPFNDLSSDPKWQRLADAVTEDVITNLSQSRDLFVIARNSTDVYKGKAVDVRDVGHDLGVKYVLEGSVDVSGDKIHITAQLIEAASRNHAWSQRYDGAIGDVADMQDDVTRKIAGTLTGYEGVLAEADRTATRRKAPANLQAYDYYLLGMESKHKETKEDNIKAQELFRRALELDPELTRAYIGLAWTYSYEISLGYTTSFSQSLDDQLSVVQKALALDPYDGEAHLGLALNYQIRGDFTRARPEFERALALAPNDADLLLISAWGVPYIGEPQKAMAMAEEAIRLNPNYPAWYNRGLTEAYYFAGAFDKALSAARQIQNPQEWNYVFLAAIYGQLNSQPGMAEAAATVRKLDPEFSGEAWVYDPAAFTARDVELKLLLDGIRKAGLPVCATEVYLQSHKDVKPLPDCDRARVKS
jgi:TolB-like protein/class 3 adenylate cyclase/Tfp pilus assembly protein PilF